MFRNRRKPPEPPTNPPEPKYTHSEHALYGRPDVEVDGVGKAAAERIDGAPLCAVHVTSTCSREGCDATQHTAYVYTVESLNIEDEPPVQDAMPTEIAQYPEDWGQYVVVVENDPTYGPAVAVEYEGERYGYALPEATIEHDDASGVCHGREDEATRLGI